VVRAATLADVPALVTLGQAFLRGSAYKDLIAENPDQMAALVGRLITGEADAVVLVADRAGTLTGMIGLVIAPHHLSGERVAMEAFWYADGGDGVRLLKRAEAWASTHGAVAMQMVAPSERIGAFYARLGYGLIEWGYMRRLAAA
jgi:hypothetical protein